MFSQVGGPDVCKFQAAAIARVGLPFVEKLVVIDPRVWGFNCLLRLEGFFFSCELHCSKISLQVIIIFC
jgi:hypothetical protein